MIKRNPGRLAAPWCAWMFLGLTCLASVTWADDIKDANRALQEGRLDEAQRLFEKASDQGLAEGRAGIGKVALRRRQYPKAVEEFRVAQKMDPNLAWGYYGEGEALKRLERYTEAVPLLQKATDIDRKFPEAQLALGECLVATGQHEPAVLALNRGLNWGPKWRPRFLVALGDAELARDSLRDAGIYYTKAREEAPEDPTPRRALGDFYMKRGTFVLAVPEYEAAIEKDSTDIDLRFRLGRALFFAERYNEALDTYKAVVALDPDYPPGQFALGDLFFRSGQADPRRYHDAKPYLQKYVEMRPDDAKGWSVLGRDLYYVGEKEAALEAMNKAEALGDQSKEMYRVRFRLYVDRREYDKAMADYARSDPEADDQMRMAQVLVIQKQPARAESLYRTMIEADSTSRSARFAYNEIGKMRFRDKDYDNAIGFFQRRIALDPQNDEAYYYAGLSHKEMKRYGEALGSLRQAAMLAPDKADRRFWLGILYAPVDSVSQARREFTRVTELDSLGTNKTTGVAYRQLGFYLLLDRQYPDAVRLLERAVEIDKQDTQAWVWLGQGRQNAGNRSSACEAYERALQLDATQPDAVKGKQSLGC